MLSKISNKKVLICLIFVLLAAISFFTIAGVASSVETHSQDIAAINDKIDTVLKLTSSSTLASVGVSAIPGDTATPIAEKLADFTEYFLIILCVLYAEKYLLTILGLGVFRVVIPCAFLAFAGGLFWRGEAMKRLGTKLLLFGLALYFAIPVSLNVSNLIYNTYEESISQTINAAEDLSTETADLTESEDTVWVTEVMKNISESVETLTNKAAQILRQFIETLAVLIVTSCIIPMLVVVFMIWIIKMLTGSDLMPFLYRPHMGRKSKVIHSTEKMMES